MKGAGRHLLTIIGVLTIGLPDFDPALPAISLCIPERWPGNSLDGRRWISSARSSRSRCRGVLAVMVQSDAFRTTHPTAGLARANLLDKDGQIINGD